MNTISVDAFRDMCEWISDHAPALKRLTRGQQPSEAGVYYRVNQDAYEVWAGLDFRPYLYVSISRECVKDMNSGRSPRSENGNTGTLRLY